jgi:hypothetical protein
VWVEYPSWRTGNYFNKLISFHSTIYKDVYINEEREPSPDLALDDLIEWVYSENQVVNSIIKDQDDFSTDEILEQLIE